MRFLSLALALGLLLRPLSHGLLLGLFLSCALRGRFGCHLTFLLHFVGRWGVLL